MTVTEGILLAVAFLLGVIVAGLIGERIVG